MASRSFAIPCHSRHGAQQPTFLSIRWRYFGNFCFHSKSGVVTAST